MASRIAPSRSRIDWRRVFALAGIGLGGAALLAWIFEETIVISGLRPEVADLWQRLKDQAAAAGIEIRAVSTIRNLDQQAKLAALGRSSQNVSWHNLGRAIDFQVKDPAAGAWDAKAKRLDLYLKVARMAEAIGFRQLGFDSGGNVRTLTAANGKPYTDPYHIEYRGNFPTLAAAVAAELPGATRIA